jgi:hypothetical protein
MLLTATSRQRVYQFRHERLKTDTMSAPDHVDGADVTNRQWGDKAAGVAIQGFARAAKSAGADGFRQHLLDFDGNPVAIDKHHARGNRQRVREYLDLVRLGGVEFDDGAPAEAHDLMNRHRRGSQNHHKIDADFIEGWHRTSYHTDKRKIA